MKIMNQTGLCDTELAWYSQNVIAGIPSIPWIMSSNATFFDALGLVLFLRFSETENKQTNKKNKKD